MKDNQPHDDLSAKMQARRSVEDQALEYGAERRDLTAKLDANTERIRRLLHEAIKHGVPIEQFAKMVGVTRQTLYHWRGEPGWGASPDRL